MASIKDMDIDKVCDDIIDGLTYAEIGQKYNVSVSQVHRFLTSEENSARAFEARTISADSYADKGEHVLKTCEGTKEEISRARELAQHYRWKAGKRNPKVYGDKVDVTSGNNPIPAAQTMSAETALLVLQAQKAVTGG